MTTGRINQIAIHFSFLPRRSQPGLGANGEKRKPQEGKRTPCARGSDEPALDGDPLAWCDFAFVFTL